MTSLKIRRNFIATCLTVAALTISSPAFPILGSGKVVFDPANHVENIATALSTAAAASSLAKIFEEAIIINAGGINAFETFSNSVEMKQMIGILQATDQMQLALREGKKSFDNIQNVFGASPYKDWSNFASNIAARKSSGDAQAIMLYDSAYAADQQIRKAFEANKKILILGSVNAIIYKNVFTKIMANKMWFTNLEHGKRVQSCQDLTPDQTYLVILNYC